MTDGEAAATVERRLWPDWALALLLVVVAGLLHGWVVSRTHVMARDSIGYIRYALRFEDHSWPKVVASMEQHPGFPTLLMLVSYPIRHFLGTTPDSMMLSAQLANALAAVLLVIPMYYLAREFFGPREAFGAALFFQILPVCLQVTSDGLSEGLYLLLTVTSLCFTAQGLRTRSGWRFGLAGLAGGLAYLTRPEGALVVLAAGLVLLGLQAWRESRWTWRQLGTSLAFLGLGAGLGGGPYPLVTGSITNKPTAVRMIEGQHPGSEIGVETGENLKADAVRSLGIARGPLLAQVLAVWYTPPDGRKTPPPLSWCLAAMVSEISRTLQYGLAGFLLIGLCFCGIWRNRPQAWLLLTVCLINMAVLIWLALSMGYISERHTLLIVACSLMPVMLGLSKVIEWLERRLASRPPLMTKAWVMLWLAVAALLLPSSLRPLHANRTGHRAAGEWLAAHARPCDIVLDPFCWAHYYAGQVIMEGKKPAPPPGSQRVRYVIVEQSKNPHIRLSKLPIARELAANGTLVYRWEPTGWLKKRAEVVEVYAVPITLPTQAVNNDW